MEEDTEDESDAHENHEPSSESISDVVVVGGQGHGRKVVGGENGPSESPPHVAVVHLVHHVDLVLPLVEPGEDKAKFCTK